MKSAEVNELIAAAQSGSETAKARLLEQFTPMLWKFARRTKTTNLDSDDLFQIAAIAFLDTVDLFDLSRTTKFITYAYSRIPWILAGEARTSGLIRTPTSTTGRASAAAFRANVVFSLDAPLKSRDGRERPRHSIIPDQSQRSPAGGDSEEVEILRDTIASLPPREADVIRRRLQGATFAEVATHLGVSMQRIQQIADRGFERLAERMKRKIKHPEAHVS